MSLILRVDDFPGTKPEEFWRHNLNNFKRFDAVLEKAGLDYVLGVIPRHTTEEQLRWLGQNQRVEVAQHGVNHDERFPNEFGAHLTVDDIYQAIVSARGPLDDLAGPVDTYIPPHNVIDARTCDALKRAGFKKIMGGPGSDADALLYAESIGLDVATSMPPFEYGRSDELLKQGSVSHIRGRLWRGEQVTLGLHWTWEWNTGLESLGVYLGSLL